MNVHRGTPSSLLQRQTWTYSPQAGYVNELEYRGFSYSQAVALANSWALAYGAQWSLTNQQGISTLVIQDSSGSYVLDIWEIGVSQVLVKSVRNPRNIANIVPVNLAIIARAESDNSTLKEASIKLNEETGAAYDFDNTNAEALRLWERIQQGQHSYWEDQYVVRHTTNVSNRYPYNIADYNKNYIYSPARFYTEVQSVILWLFPMPQAFVNVLTSNTPPTAEANYLWGYLKSGSPRITVANNRTQIVTEYRQAMWPTDEYASVT